MLIIKRNYRVKLHANCIELIYFNFIIFNNETYWLLDG